MGWDTSQWQSKLEEFEEFSYRDQFCAVASSARHYIDYVGDTNEEKAIERAERAATTLNDIAAHLKEDQLEELITECPEAWENFVEIYLYGQEQTASHEVHIRVQQMFLDELNQIFNSIMVAKNGIASVAFFIILFNTGLFLQSMVASNLPWWAYGSLIVLGSFVVFLWLSLQHAASRKIEFLQRRWHDLAALAPMCLTWQAVRLDFAAEGWHAMRHPIQQLKKLGRALVDKWNDDVPQYSLTD